MNVWRLILPRSNPAASMRWVREHGRIAIGGGDIGDIAGRGIRSRREIKAALEAAYPGIANATPGSGFLWGLFALMKVGDLVILTGRKPREAVVEVAGGYEWRHDGPVPGDFNHQRTVRITSLDAEVVWRLAGGAPQAGHSIRWTLVPMAREVAESGL